MLAKILIAAGVFMYAVVVPLLEINASHVFNPAWTEHARFHEVWQLSTNIMIGICALWLAFKNNAIRLAAVLNIAVMGGVLVAHSLEHTYGGSIISGTIRSTVAGIETAAFAAAVVVVMAVLALLLAGRQRDS